MIEPHLEYHERLSDAGPGPSGHEFCRFVKFMRVQTPDGKGLRTSKHRPYVIYALIDPRDMTVRYVGRTRSMRKRRDEHWREPVNEDMRAWRDDLSSIGEKFIIAPITVSTEREAKRAEAYWIAFYRSNGTLYNVSAGESDDSEQSRSLRRDAWGYAESSTPPNAKIQ